MGTLRKSKCTDARQGSTWQAAFQTQAMEIGLRPVRQLFYTMPKGIWLTRYLAFWGLSKAWLKGSVRGEQCREKGRNTAGSVPPPLLLAEEMKAWAMSGLIRPSACLPTWFYCSSQRKHRWFSTHCTLQHIFSYFLRSTHISCSCVLHVLELAI